MTLSILQRKLLLRFLFIFVFYTPLVLFGGIPEKNLKIMPPMNEIYHPVSTTNMDAQKHFNRGLTYIFAFNHDIAFREFEAASKTDPNLAMAYWGMALALGQNVNEDVTPENEIRCYNYIQEALKLSSNASANEQKYISALAERYTNDPSADLIPLRFKYRNAMKKVVEAYPKDLDAAAMYAESILDLDPWKWWTLNGKPKEGTNEAIDVLDSILTQDPDHIGANHFYIHAWEESPTPERALMSAHRLQYLFPESGHLVHMSCHIFIPVGDYEAALKASVDAIAQDKDYMKKVGISAGTYPLHYLSHNTYVLSRTYMLMEDYENALKTALELVEFVGPYLEKMPHLASFANAPLEIYLYFHKWKELLEHPLQSKTASGQAYWHFSRATAYASLGNMDAAQKEKDLMVQFQQQITPSEEIAKNHADKVLELAATILNATFAHAQKNNFDYLDYLKKGTEIQDRLYYDEPPAWYVPVSQVLGFALLQQQQYTAAEASFEKSLKSLQRNGRSLFGLALSLKGQSRDIGAYWVEREAKAALKHASAPLQLNDL